MPFAAQSLEEPDPYSFPPTTTNGVPASWYFMEGENQETLGLDGSEVYDIEGLSQNLTAGKIVDVRATKPDGSIIEFKAKLRLDSGVDVEYYKHGGILNYVLRNFLKSEN